MFYVRGINKIENFIKLVQNLCMRKIQRCSLTMLRCHQITKGGRVVAEIKGALTNGLSVKETNRSYHNLHLLR